MLEWHSYVAKEREKALATTNADKSLKYNVLGIEKPNCSYNVIDLISTM